MHVANAAACSEIGQWIAPYYETSHLLLSVGSGYAIPLGPEFFSKYNHAGTNYHLGIGYLNKNIVLMIRSNFSSHTYGKNISNQVHDYSGGEVSILSFSGEFRTYSRKKISPFMYVGFNLLFIFRREKVKLYYEDGYDEIALVSENANGIILGAGIDVKLLEPLKMFLEGSYMLCNTDFGNTRMIPIKIGLLMKL
jgi:hypothetical protein